MQGYKGWKKWHAGSGMKNYRGSYKNNAKDDDEYVDENDFGYDDSYDYAEHYYVGNSAGQRQAEMTHEAQPNVKHEIDHDQDWESDDETAKEFHVPSTKPKLTLSEAVTAHLMNRMAKKEVIERIKKNEERSSKSRREALLSALKERGVDCPAEQLTTTVLTQLLEAVTDRRSFDPASYEELWAKEEAESERFAAKEKQRRKKKNSNTARRQSEEPPCDGMVVHYSYDGMQEEAESKQPSRIVELPCEIWTMIGTYFSTILPVMRLSSTSTYMRDLLEDTDCFRDKWQSCRVSYCTTWSAARQSLLMVSAVETLPNGYAFTRPVVKGYSHYQQLPPRAYRWSWHLSLRRELIETVCHVFYERLTTTTRSLRYLALAPLDAVSNKMRDCDANAWFHLFLQATNEHAKKFAQIQVNRYVGMGNIALELSEAFFHPVSFQQVPTSVCRKLQIPSTPEAIEAFFSSLRVLSLDSTKEREFDVALDAERKVLAQASTPIDEMEPLYSDDEDSFESASEGEEEQINQLMYHDVQLHSTVLQLKIPDVVNEVELRDPSTLKKQEKRYGPHPDGGRQFYSSKNVRKTATLGRRARRATKAQERVYKQFLNIGKVAGWGADTLGLAQQEYCYRSINCRQKHRKNFLFGSHHPFGYKYRDVVFKGMYSPQAAGTPVYGYMKQY